MVGYLNYFQPPVDTYVNETAETVCIVLNFALAGLVLVACLGFVAKRPGPGGLPRPDTIKLDPSPNNHAAFGLSVHRCVGAQLGRLEFEVVLKTVLERIPEYRIDRERAHRYPSYGLTTGWSILPTTFAPGEPTGDGTLPTLHRT